MLTVTRCFAIPFPSEFKLEFAILGAAARFDTEPAFLDWHNEHYFVDHRAA
jgi:hypothetical protein